MPVLTHLRGVHDLPAIPPHLTAQEVLGQVLPSWKTSRRTPVTEAAAKFMMVNANGRWVNFDPETTPYMVEPANMMISRLYRELIFLGPARAGKTVFLLSSLAHTIMCNPGKVKLVHMGEVPARTWVDAELAEMISNSDAIAARLGTGVSDNNTFSKNFDGGTNLEITWPTVERLSNYTVRDMLLTDIDQMKLNIGGKGSAFALAAKRTEIAGSGGMAAAESSPSHNITDPDWSPSGPHELPPAPGIVELFNGGTRARLYWECRSCGHEFAPHYDLLEYDENLPPAEAGDQAFMACPSCGEVIEHRHKPEFNRAILKDRGGWRHETADGGIAAIESGEVKRSQRISYHLDGTAAAFATWARQVAKLETARRTLETLADEGPMQTTINVDQGWPYLPLALREKRNLTLEDLRAQAHGTPQGVAPKWTRYVILSADVQKGKWVVQATAFGEGLEAQIIDRFDVHQPPQDAPNAEGRTARPDLYVEDWAALLPLLDRVYPLEGAEYGLRPMAMVCDFHGEPGVSDRATEFWQGRRAAGEVKRWYMYRGHGGFKAPDRYWYKAPTRSNTGGQARDIKLFNIATDRMKDTVVAGLTRVESGPSAIHVGAWQTDEHLGELVAEVRTSSGYEKRKGVVRNEAIYLTMAARALAEFKGGGRIDLAKPFPWARLGPSNENAVLVDDAGEVPATAPRAEREAPRLPTKIKFLED